MIRDSRTETSRSERTRQERVRDVYSRRDGGWDDDDYYGRESNGKGPKFCQSGAGHPVHGMSWCYEKGFGRKNDRWSSRRDRDDVIVIRPDRRSRTRTNRDLEDIFEDVVLGRDENHRVLLNVGSLLLDSSLR